MATSRRVFLELVGVGAAGTTVNLGCRGLVDDVGGLPVPDPDPGMGTGTGGHQSGEGGQTGQGGDPGTGGQGDFGTGGTQGGGQGGATADAGTIRRDAAAADTNPPRDAGTVPPVLGPGDLAAGNVSSLAVGALNAIPSRSVGIARDANGVYALTLVCTHQGCTATPSGAVGARTINCPCHGSQFDRNGAVTRGPATRALVHYSVTVDASGNIVVHTNTQVAAGIRAVP